MRRIAQENFADELQVIADSHHLPSHALVMLTTGLYLLRQDAVCGRDEVLASLDALGGVRLCGELLVAAADPRSLVAAARTQCKSIRQKPRWTLAYEERYPAAEMWMIPMTRCQLAPSLLIGLHAALGADGFVDPWCAASNGDNGKGDDDSTELSVLMRLYMVYY